MNRSRSFASNALWSLALQIVTVIAGFIVPRVIIGTYGSQMNGLVTSLTQMVGYLALVEAGISAAAIFALYKPLADSDEAAIGIIVSAARRFYYRSGIVFVVLAIVLAFAYPMFVDCGKLDAIQVGVLVGALCAPGFLDFFTLAKYRVLLTADQRNWVIQAASIVYRVLYVIVIVAMADANAPLHLVYVAAIVPIVVRTVILIIYSKIRYSHIDFSADCGDYELEQRWDAFYLQILGVVQAGFPVLVATFVIGDLVTVSVYAVYMLVANGIQQLCATVTNGTQATFGDVIARGDTPTLLQTYSEMGSMMGIINSAASGTAAAMIGSFVMLYTGDIADADYSAPLLGILVMVNVFLYHLKTPEGLLVVSGGKYRESRPFVTVQALILAIGSVVGALAGGIEGMVIGVCASNVYAAVYLNFFIPKRVTGGRKRDTTRKYLVTVAAFSLPAALSFLQILPFPAEWGAWLVECACVAALCVMWSFAVFILFDRKATIAVLNRAVRLLKRRI